MSDKHEHVMQYSAEEHGYQCEHCVLFVSSLLIDHNSGETAAMLVTWLTKEGVINEQR